MSEDFSPLTHSCFNFENIRNVFKTILYIEIKTYLAPALWKIKLIVQSFYLIVLSQLHTKIARSDLVFEC